MLGPIGIGRESLLDFHSALNGIHGARELGQNAVTSSVGDAPAMLANEADP